MRKVTVELKVKLLINADEGIEISNVINEMGYEFVYSEPGAEIVDSGIEDYEITDSK
jgi:hypothetical protein